MTAPLTDQQIAEIRARHDRDSNSGAWRTTEQAAAVTDRGLLLAENGRLRAELADWQAANAQRLAEITKALRYLNAGDHDSARSVLVTAGGGTDRLNAPADPCRAEPVHQTGCPNA